MNRLSLPSLRETVWVLVLSALFLTLTGLYVGLRIDHFLILALYWVLFFASGITRRLAVALLPFVVFAVSYDWMRVYPNYEVNPVDVRGLYGAEKSLFGIQTDGTVLIPCEFFARYHCVLADVLAGIFYLCWVPVPVAFGIWLYARGQRQLYLRFAMVFLFVNLIGFVGYYIYPAAPPDSRQEPPDLKGSPGADTPPDADAHPRYTPAGCWRPDVSGPSPAHTPGNPD